MIAETYRGSVSPPQDDLMGAFLINLGDRVMTTESRLGPGGQKLSAAGTSHGGVDSEDSSSREVDERTAIYLLSLARELLRRDHSAIAGMIDYAIVEIEVQGGEDD